MFRNDDQDLLRRIGLLGEDAPVSAFRDYSPQTQPGYNLLGADRSEVDFNQDKEYQKNWLERVFSPVLAPQQTLFALTTGHNLWDSLAHGARYFNPWSNEEPIDPDTVRETLFGEMADGWVKGTANLAIGVLFDPLWLAPVAKVAGLTGRALRTVERTVNPAALVLDAAGKVATDVVGPLSKTAYARVFGEEALQNAERLASEFMVSAVNRFHNVPEGVRNIVNDAEGLKQDLIGDGIRALRTADRLSPDLAPLMTEALQSHEMFAKMNNLADATPEMIKAANTLYQRVLDAGVSPELFEQVYRRVRGVNDRVGEMLWEMGVISEAEFTAGKGTHLRRIFQKHEAPQVYMERINRLVESGGGTPDVIGTTPDIFRKRMSTFRNVISRDMGPMGRQSGMFDTPETQRLIERYFDNTGKFHAKNFSDDFLDYLGSTTDDSISEVLTHVRDNMFGGMQLPPEFTEALANHISGALYVTPGTSTVAKRIQAEGMSWLMGENAPSFSFRSYRENLQVVAQRKDISPEMLELLGEITDFIPRTAAEVRDVSGVLMSRKMFDDISGVRRLSADSFESLTEARRLGLATDEGRQLVQKVADDMGVSIDTLASSFDDLMEEGVGAIVGSKGSAWASLERNADLGHLWQMPKDKSYGEMAGMWTDASTRSLLRASDARDSIRSQEGRLLNALGELYRDGVGVFKFMKAVADPTGQTRNFLGGAILASMSGLGWDAIKIIPKVRAEMRSWIQSGDFGHYMKLADAAGVNIWKQDLVSTELRDIVTRRFPELARDSGATHTKFFSNVLEAFNQKLSNIPGVRKMMSAATGGAGDTLMDGVAHNFQFGDQFWKMGVFIHHYDKLAGAAAKAGKTITQEMQNSFAKQAAGLAQEALFNYADVPFLIDFVRKWGIVPFATFPFKAIPYTAKTLYDTPWRVLQYDRLMDGINNMQVKSPDDLAREIDDLPEYLRDNLILRLPWADGKGRTQFIDLSYYMPWDTINDMKESAEWEGGFRRGLADPPFMAIFDAIRNNKDLRGRAIWDEQRTNLQNFESLGNFLTAFMMPAWSLGGVRSDSLGRSLMASATDSPQAVNWKDRLGVTLRSPGGSLLEMLGLGESVTRENVLSAGGQLPASHAQATRGAPSFFTTGFATSLLGGATATTPGRGMQERASNRSQILRQIGQIRASNNLSLAEKNRRIQALQREFLGK